MQAAGTGLKANPSLKNPSETQTGQHTLAQGCQFFKSRVPPLTKNAGPGVLPGTKKKSNNIFAKSKNDRLLGCEKNFNQSLVL